MQILLIMLALELSGMKGVNEFYSPYDYNNDDVILETTFFITFEAEIQIYEILYIKGSAKTIMYLENDFNFQPSGLSSFIEAGLKYKGFIIGLRHICIHPIIPYMNNVTTKLFVDQAANEMFLRYEMKKKVF